ncbi:hypothetical protein AXK12_00980 [Cephaloticoccus capnophilus]|uniref:AAA domain-containing protein n=1 Tax=Cephaloticoccus capnophilus TaxID=1548208 RepID=A0A139SU05_9BACT|nr:polysaccharide biosynthesis tyrosine autokinase [Cephaloticoccus capnophilus]KXU37962.1 hypothetical protein AXK12_00980 [Cephaloticoccus capnophilus]
MAEPAGSSPTPPVPLGAAPSSSAADAPVEQRRSLRDYYVILRERFWIALPLALLVSLVIGYYQARQTPMYASTAIIQFERPETVVTTQTVMDATIRNELDLNTYIHQLTSNRVRTRVLESLTPEEVAIIQRPYLKSQAPGEPLPPLAAMLGLLSIDPVRNSFILRLTVGHQDPEAAAILAQRHVDQFLSYLLENISGVNDTAVDFLRERAEQLRLESEAKAQRQQEYMQRHNLISLDNSTSIVDSRLLAVNGSLTQARLRLLEVESLAKQVDDYQEAGANLLEITYIGNYNTVAPLRGQMTTLLQEQARLAERYLERHPRMIEVTNAIIITQEHLDLAVQGAIADLKTSLIEVKKTIAQLENEYAENEKEALSLRNMRVDFESLQNEAAVARANYMQILDRLNQTTTTKYLEKVPIRLLDRAQVSGRPYTPNFPKIVRMCVMMFCVVFFGTAFGLDFIDDRIKSAWDIENFLGTSLLGIVPDLASVKDEDKYTLLLKDTHPTAVEAFMGIYGAAKTHSLVDYPKSMLVTSTIPGEGKTLVSANLAASFARHGKRTLLVDCDLRRPMLHRRFDLANTSGIIAFYEADGDLDCDLPNDSTLGIVKLSENLSLLRSGGRSRRPTELLESPFFGDLLQKLGHYYDLIIIDSPPLGAVTDGLLIAERVDEVAYVCRFNRAHRKHIQLYMRALRNAKTEVLGVVLNGLTPRRVEYYSNYRYYRSYGKYTERVDRPERETKRPKKVVEEAEVSEIA